MPQEPSGAGAPSEPPEVEAAGAGSLANEEEPIPPEVLAQMHVQMVPVDHPIAPQSPLGGHHAVLQDHNDLSFALPLLIHPAPAPPPPAPLIPPGTAPLEWRRHDLPDDSVNEPRQAEREKRQAEEEKKPPK